MEQTPIKHTSELWKIAYEIESLHKESSHKISMQDKEILDLKTANDDMDVTILNYSMDIVPSLKKEIEQLKAEKSILSYI